MHICLNISKLTGVKPEHTERYVQDLTHNRVHNYQGEAVAWELRAQDNSPSLTCSL